MDTQKNIVVAGGGFGGIRVALDLSRFFKTHPEVASEFDIVLINKQAYHLFTPSIYEVASAKREDADAWNLKQIVTVPHEIIFRGKPVRIIQDEITAIDLTKEEVRLKEGSPIPFLYLVLALGSVVNNFGIPGIAEYAISLKEFPDAIRIRNAIAGIVKEKQRGIQICIGGAGATGVELAGEVLNYIKKLGREGLCSPKEISITIVEAGPRILPGLPDRAANMAKKRLERFGVTILLSTAITKVEPRTVFLKNIPQNAEYSRETDITIWAGGTKVNPVMAEVVMPKDKKGRCVVDPAMHVGGEHPGGQIFALGDLSCFLDPRTGNPIPGNAYVAIDEGKIIAKNIAAHILHHPEHHYHIPQYFPYLIPIKGKYTIFSRGSITITGFFGWIMRLFADLRYFVSVLPPPIALRLWFKGVWIQMKND